MGHSPPCYPPKSRQCMPAPVSGSRQRTIRPAAILGAMSGQHVSMSSHSRRWFVQATSLAGLGLLAGCGRWQGQAQPPAKVRSIGLLLPAGIAASQVHAFRDALHSYGYVEGQNLTIETRQAQATSAQLPALAA